MRVMQVIVSHRGWGGADHQACTLANGLAEKMHSLMLAPQGHHIFTRLSAKVQGVPLTLGNGFRPQLILPFVRLVRREQIDIIDFHSSHGHNFALLVRRLLPRVRFVVHRHNVYRPSRGWLGRYKFLHSGIDHYICVSQLSERMLLERGVTTKKISVVRATALAGDPPRDRPQQKKKICHRYHLDPAKPLIGVVANLIEPRKGYGKLLRALNIIKREGVAFQVICCGEGDDRAVIEKIRADLNLQQEVHFVGFVRDITAVLGALDVFCLPSVDECFSVALQEAMHARCPILTTDSGGTPEMIRHRYNGLLSAAASAEELAANLKLILHDQALRARLAANGKTYVEQNLSAEKMVAETAQIYRRLLGA